MQQKPKIRLFLGYSKKEITICKRINFEGINRVAFLLSTGIAWSLEK